MVVPLIVAPLHLFLAVALILVLIAGMVVCFMDIAMLCALDREDPTPAARTGVDLP